MYHPPHQTGNVSCLTARIYIKSCLLFLNALRSENQLVSEMRNITTLLNCIMDPLIYAYGACFFIYSFQVFNIKQPRDFLVDLVMNFINKLSLENYTKIERYISHFLNMYFEYVDLNCSMEFKNKLLQKCGEFKSSTC